LKIGNRTTISGTNTRLCHLLIVGSVLLDQSPSVPERNIIIAYINK